MKIYLYQISHARSGDKGANSNIGLIFYSQEVYQWAKEYLSSSKVKKYLKSIVKGSVIRFEMDNLNALNFILEDSLGGGGSESLFNDAQGKTHAQALLKMEVEIPDNLISKIKE